MLNSSDAAAEWNANNHRHCLMAFGTVLHLG
jgi:hypothetical protein